MIILDIIKQIGNIVKSFWGFRKEKSLNPASTELTHDEKQEMPRGTDIRERIVDETIKAFYTSESEVLAASGVSQEKAKKINQLLNSVLEELPTDIARKRFNEARNFYITGLEREMNNPLAYIPEKYKPEVDKLDMTQKDELFTDIIKRDRSYRLNVLASILGSNALNSEQLSLLREQYIDAYINLEGENVYRYFGIDRTEPNADSDIIHKKFDTSAVAIREYISAISSIGGNFVRQKYPMTGQNIDPRGTYRKEDNDGHKRANDDMIHS